MAKTFRKKSHKDAEEFERIESNGPKAEKSR